MVKQNKKIIFYSLKLFLILRCLLWNINRNTNLKLLSLNLHSKNNKNYFNFIIYKIKKLKKKKNINKPQISIISPIYNRDKYILRFLIGIQYQNFKEIEIILIDDCSQDNSVNLIYEYKKKENRIKLIKNIINKGTFVCRNMGVLFSKGKYIVLQDPDDILSKNIIDLCFKYAEKYNYEMIRFNIFFGKEEKLKNKLENKCIYQPELSTYLFYGNNNELEKIDVMINNKFIKREVYIKALNLLEKFYLKLYIIIYEDQLLVFFLYKTANSFFYLNKIGYYYIRNSKSITKNEKKITKLKLKFIFIYIRLVFEFSKNNKYEIDITNSLLTNYINSFYIDKKKSTNKNDIKFFKDIINIFLNNLFITGGIEHKLKKIKKNIKNIQKYKLI